MKFLILLSLISLASCKELIDSNATDVDETFTKGRKIIGGFEMPSVIAYQAALIDISSDIVFCGGSIISRNWILTAAHCITRVEAKGLSYYVRVGSRRYDSGGQQLQVRNRIVLPKYDGGPFDKDWDVALLQVEDIHFNSQVAPIQLPYENQVIPDDTVVLVSGWGRMQYNIKAKPYYLRAAALRVGNWDQCKQTEQILTTRMICAYGEGKNSCNGDSGGPLARGNTLVGIASFGTKTCVDPMIYVNVANSEIRRFIKERSGV